MRTEFGFKVVVIGTNDDVRRAFPTDFYQQNKATIGVDFSRSAISAHGSEIGQINIWHIARSSLHEFSFSTYVRNATSFVYFDDKERGVDSEAESFYRFCTAAEEKGLPAIRVGQPREENGREVVDVSYKLPDGSPVTTHTVPKEEAVQHVKKMTYVAATTARDFGRSLEQPAVSTQTPIETKKSEPLVKESNFAKFVAALKSGFDAILKGVSNTKENIASFFRSKKPEKPEKVVPVLGVVAKEVSVEPVEGVVVAPAPGMKK